MKKRIAAVLLAVCLLIPCCITCFAQEKPYCLHENAEWELAFPPTPVTDSYYKRVCPDCGMRQTAKKARTSYAERIFEILSGLVFIFEKPAFSDSLAITAHTGPGEISMNTMFSLRYQLQSGADIVEFDLNLNSDGVAVMTHGEPDKAKVTVDEAFALIAKYMDTKVNVDVKNVNAVSQAQELAIKHGILDRIFYTGVSAGDVEKVKAMSPLVPYYLNCSGADGEEECAKLCDYAVSLGAIGINMNYSSYTPELSAAARERGLLISLWTVNKPSEMRKYIGYDIDNITTEFPFFLYSMTGGFKDKF